MRSTGIFMKSPANSFSRRARHDGTRLAGDLDAVGLAELARSVCGTRCSGDSCTGQPWIGVERAFVGMAVFLEAALQQDDDARLAARGRAEQQQQAAADFGAGAGRAEVVGDASERFVDAEELVLEQRVAEHVVVAVSSCPASGSCPTCTGGCGAWPCAGWACTISSRNVANVPDQCFALCWRVKPTRLSMNWVCCSLLPDSVLILCGPSVPVSGATGVRNGASALVALPVRLIVAGWPESRFRSSGRSMVPSHVVNSPNALAFA